MLADPTTMPGAAGFTAAWLGQRVVFADGALDRLPGELGRLNASLVLLIAASRDNLPDRLAVLLGDRLADRWTDVRQHVPAELAAQVTTQARLLGADLVVCAGGGSATGLAKIVARDAGVPVLAIPTTYAGSEMTPVWGISEGAAKRTGRNPGVLPATVIYDPDLLAGLPPAMAGSSAMNALAHCAEALYSAQADPLTSLGAAEGARLIAEFLDPAGRPASAEAGQTARRGLLWAACLAGRAFGTVGGSPHHGICHLLGGSAGLPHARTHAVMLPHVLAFLRPAIAPKLARLSGAIGAEPADVAGAIWDLRARSGAPGSLRELGLAERELPVLAQAIAARHLASPRPLDATGALAVLTAAWHGDRPARAPEVASPGRSPAPVTGAGLTGTVIARLQATPDPRLRQVMIALIGSLHGFVTQTRLTGSELMAAIGFLTETGQMCSDRRQEFILLSDTLGVSMLVDLLAGPAAEGAAGRATESTVLGPFYLAGSPERAYGASMAERPPAQPAWFSGRVIALDGTPIGGATLDVWQNDDDMLYSVQNADAPPGHLRGVFRTRPDGSYAFLGVRPTDYPIPDDGPVGRLLTATGRHPWRPAHIHLIVSAPGYRSVATHIFDAQSQYLSSDAVFAVKPSLVRAFVRHEPGADAPEGVPSGSPWYSLSYDFVLEPG